MGRIIMASPAKNTVYRLFRTVFDAGALGALSDAELLEKFTTGRRDVAQTAFEILMERHASMVLAVCRRSLADPNDVEDAFQAVFLLLVRKASKLWVRDSLAGWLHGTARKVAEQARKDKIKQNKRAHGCMELVSATVSLAEPATIDRDDLRALDEEIGELPDKYRLPIILCYLEGLTHEAVASRLGVPVGTIRGRMARARETLKRRLTRRRVTIPAMLASVGIAIERTRAAIVPPQLARKTMQIVINCSPESTAYAWAERVAAATAAEAIRRTVAIAFLCVGTLVAGGTAYHAVQVGAARNSHDAPRNETAAAERNEPPKKDPKTAKIASAVPDQNRADTKIAEPPNRTLDLKVVDIIDAPVAMADVYISYLVKFHGELNRRDWNSKTDQKGETRIELADNPYGFIRIEVRKKGFATRAWTDRADNINKAYHMPKNHTMRLIPGTVVGGFVRDEDGKPIAGAKTTVDSIDKDTEHPDFMYVDNYNTLTDNQGRWFCDEAPEDTSDCLIEVDHPDFVPTILTRSSKKPGAMELRDGTSVITLERGVPLDGIVLDDRGTPIPNAKVALIPTLEIHRKRDKRPFVFADENGRFRFAHVSKGGQIVTASADGRAPDLQLIAIFDHPRPIIFRLGAAKAFRGRIVDKTGKPFAGAKIKAVSWRGQDALEWSAVSNDEGRFSWNQAPIDEFKIHIKNIISNDSSSHDMTAIVAASDRETTIVFNGPPVLFGDVIDAATGNPVRLFRVIPGKSSGYVEFRNVVKNTVKKTDIITWDYSLSQRFEDGKFSFKFTVIDDAPYRNQSNDRNYFRIEAPGYVPFVTEAYHALEGESTGKYALQKIAPNQSNRSSIRIDEPRRSRPMIIH